MKKIFTYLSSAALIILLFTSCAKENVYDERGHWLTQESGDVVYSNNVCGYYVVETNYGYTIIENLDGLSIFKGDIVYGNFGSNGSRNFYNLNADLVTLGRVVEYDLTYNKTLDALDYYCPVGVNGFRMNQNTTSQPKIERIITPLK